VAALGVEITMIDFFGTRVEVIVPTAPDSRAAEQLEAGQGGVHHFGLRTDDAAAALAGLAGAGFELLDRTPRDGVRASRIGFARIGPALVELVQPAADDPPPLTWQLRTYDLYADKVDGFLAFWRDGVVPLRRRLGFTVAGGWLDAEAAVFIWLVGHPAPDGWEEAERTYYASPLRAELPDPRQFVAAFEARLLRQVQA
jgi:hypothetical protein